MQPDTRSMGWGSSSYLTHVRGVHLNVGGEVEQDEENFGEMVWAIVEWGNGVVPFRIGIG